MELQTTRHATFLLHAHLVFVTKYRYKIFTKEQLEYMKLILQETLHEMDSTLVEFDGEKDHVHLLIQYPPRLSVALIVNNLKGRTSRYLRRDYPELKEKYYGESALWSRSYFAASVGGAPLEIVKQYIQNQTTPV